MPDLLTTESVAFAHSLTFADLGEDLVLAAKRCLVDGIGVAIAGVETDVSRKLKAHIVASADQGACRLFGAGAQTTTTSQAALYLGTCGNALDWDDVQLPEGDARPFGLLMHGTTPLLAAALTATDIARAQGRTISGQDFLTAFIAGWEVAGKLALTVTPDHYFAGFHSTGTIGTFGCAIAAGKILGLTEHQMMWSLGHAASMAAGVRASMGTMTKPMHVGWCAARGIGAALLARAGLDGAGDALDGPSGYLATASTKVHVERAIGRFGKPFVLGAPGVSAKPYPCGAVTHPGMHALSQVMSEQSLTAEMIKDIAVSAPATMWNVISYPFASTPFEAKYCFPFLLAAIALRGSAGRAEFREEFIRSEACIAFQKKVQIQTDDALEDLSSDIVPTRLSIKTQDGRTITFEGQADYPGGPVQPLDDASVDAKFENTVAGLLPADHAAAVRSLLRTFDVEADAGVLLDTVGTITVPELKQA